tara:strand:+ start:1817 stop:2011 length:195 start_codon:yes stop_codon:yes gene_type:complete
MSDYRSRDYRHGSPTPKSTPKPNSNKFYKKQKKRPVRSIPLDMAGMSADKIIAGYNREIPKRKA